MITDLVLKIQEANKSYRIGKPIMSDTQYDILIEELRELDPDNEILNEVGHVIIDESRKSKLPIGMASMNKVKTIDDISNWCRLKGIKSSENAVITPKYDGLSLCVDEFTNEAWTRGDGEFGQKSDSHYKLIKNHLNIDTEIFTYGEVMMPKSVFINRYSNDFANPRNLVAGLLNSKDINPNLEDTVYIKYGLESKANSDFKNKSDILKFLNTNQDYKVPFEVISIKDITHERLFDLFKLWSADFEIDGLIIEVDSIDVQNKLGRETSSNNPCWARAYKSPDFEQVAETTIIGISWNISKQGYLKPTLHVSPIKLDGVTISNVTGNNARFVKDMGLGIGAVVLIKRSGMVIPIIHDVIAPVPFVLPNVPDIDWNENGIELITLTETDEQRFKQAVSFFEILEVDSVREGVIKQLWNAGFNSIKSILEVTPDKLSNLEGFGKRKSVIVYNAIQSKIKDVQLSKLQHATGMFKGLGSKKLLLLEHFTTKPTVDDIISIDGFAETSAKSYIESYDKFFDFIKDLPITVNKQKELVQTSNDLENSSFVFTGIRRPDLEEVIKSRGGKIGSGVSKNTTHLVMKSKGSGSSKEEKAIQLGITILEIKDLEDILK